MFTCLLRLGVNAQKVRNKKFQDETQGNQHFRLKWQEKVVKVKGTGGIHSMKIKSGKRFGGKAFRVVLILNGLG